MVISQSTAATHFIQAQDMDKSFGIEVVMDNCIKSGAKKEANNYSIWNHNFCWCQSRDKQNLTASAAIYIMHIFIQFYICIRYLYKAYYIRDLVDICIRWLGRERGAFGSNRTNLSGQTTVKSRFVTSNL